MFCGGSAVAETQSYDFVIAAFEDDTYSSRGITPQNKVYSYEQCIGTWGGFKFSSYWRWDLGSAFPSAIPKNAVIRKAYLELTGCFNSTVPVKSTFRALVPDGKWEKNGTYPGFHENNYSAYGLDSIPVMGTQMDWYLADDWTWLSVHRSPDISNLVQRFVSDERYDPAVPDKSYFGLRCYFIESYGASSAYRRAYAQLDPDYYDPPLAPIADYLLPRLHVEWDDEEARENPEGDESTDVFQVADIHDDTFLIWGPWDGNGNYYNDNGYYYTGCTQYDYEHQINGRLDLNCARWRWILDPITRGAVIKSATLKVTGWHEQPPYPAGSFPPGPGYLDLSVSHLVPDGIWDNKTGDGFEDYGMCLLPNGIPGFGNVTEEILPIIPEWTEYTLPHNLGSLVQNFVNSTWDDSYNFFNLLEDRHYEYAKGDYFGLACGTGGWKDNVFQGLTRLSVTWAPREFFSATYYMKNETEGDLVDQEDRDDYEDTFSDGINNNVYSETVQIGNGKKGYWRFGLSVPKYAVIQKASLIYTIPEGSFQLENPVFNTLYAHCWGWHENTGCTTWHGSAGFRKEFLTGTGTNVSCYPTAAYLEAICRNTRSTTEYESCTITDDPHNSVDITKLVQACVDHGHYEPGEYFAIALDNATNSVEIPENSLAVYVEWLMLFKH